MTRGEPVTRIRAGLPTGERDRYGHEVLGPDVETPLPRAMFAPNSAGSTEPLADARDQVLTVANLFWRGPVDLAATDRVRVRGDVYEVDGRPSVWVRNGRTVGVVVTLKLPEG